MKQVLRQLAQHGELSWLSFHFAEFIARQAGRELDHLLPLTAALVSEASQQGHVCIDLAQRAGQPLFASSRLEARRLPRAGSTEDWCEALLQTPCVAAAGERAPLTLDDTRLYLNRFWHYETEVARGLDSLAAVGAGGEDSPAVAAGLDADQQRALQIAARRQFCVISGGPGSGKTSTMVRILEHLLSRQPDCRIALAAPTGKAAARMMDSIRHGLGDDVRDQARHASYEGSTIHRLLGYRRHGFRYGRDCPLPLDCVIVDEASMIDLKLMYHLLTALPPTARLILLGDRDQLASVAAGNVLGDITGHGFGLDCGPAALTDAIVLLRHNYRFDRDSAIGELAQRVNAGDPDAALALLARNERGLHWYRSTDAREHDTALEWVFDAYQPIFESASAAEALEIYESTRVLCATNSGPAGVDRLNAEISAALLRRNGRADSEFYSGLPIMIARNHHELALYNGDTGILWQQPQGLRACFRDPSGAVREIALNRLPEFGPAWASTVHKSQGSEFDSVLLVLPAQAESEALSRELLYTAITRARRRFALLGSDDCFAAAAARLTRRESGLAQRLGWRRRGAA